MSKYTSGPWVMEIVTDHKGDEVYARIKGIAFSNGIKIGVYRNKLPGEALANAHLIASAPELLEALKEYVEFMGSAHENECPQDDTCNCKGKPINDKVNQVVTRAEGGE